MSGFHVPPGRFTLAGPPRSVPLAVRAALLFGGFLNQFGWGFFGFGMIFVWVFGMRTDPLAWRDFAGDLQQVQGVVTRCEDTGASVGGSEHSRGTPIYAHHFRFEVNGQSYEGVSYTVGTQTKPAQAVTVEFPPGNPARCRIRGMQTAMFPPWLLLICIFPVVGFCFLTAGFLRGRRAIRLLKEGLVARGALRSKEPTNTRINRRTVYKLTFAFQDELGQTHEAVARTHEPERLEDDAEEPLLYDPVHPSRATLLDHLPGAPRIDDMGQIQTQSSARAMLTLVLPTITVIGHGLYLWYWLQRA